MAPTGQRLTAQEAIAAARRNPKTKKLGGTFSVLREFVANANTRRVGDQAFAEARAHHIKLYQHGILADVLRSGGFLLIQTLPPMKKTNPMNPLPFVSFIHLVSLGRDGVPADVLWGPAIDVANTRKLVKVTTEIAEKLYSTRPLEATSLESRFFGDRYPKYSGSEAKIYSQIAVPRSLLKLGAEPNEVLEFVALYGGLQILVFQYAVSMPTFAANPYVTTQAAVGKWRALQAEFLRNNRMDPHLDFDPENIRSKKQLRDWIAILKRLDKFMEEALNNEANPAVVKANRAVATIPVEFGTDSDRGKGVYTSDTASLLLFYWQRLPAGGFAVKFFSLSPD